MEWLTDVLHLVEVCICIGAVAILGKFVISAMLKIAELLKYSLDTIKEIIKEMKDNNKEK